MGIEETVSGRRPGTAAAGVLDPVFEVRAGGDIAHFQRKEFGALVVEAPNDAAVIRRVVCARQTKIALAGRLEVAIENDFAVAAVPRLPEETRLLAAGDEGGAVGERTVGGGHRAVVFLDAALHLGEELFPQV
jgi:hypothetical protein